MYTRSIYYFATNPQTREKRFLILVRKKYEDNWEVYIAKDSYHGSVTEVTKNLIVEALVFTNVYDVKVVEY